MDILTNAFYERIFVKIASTVEFREFLAKGEAVCHRQYWLCTPCLSMSTFYCQSIQDRISRLAAEYARLEQQSTAAFAKFSSNQTREQKLKRGKDWLTSNEALRKVETRLHQARRLLARAQGDEYMFKNS